MDEGRHRSNAWLCSTLGRRPQRAPRVEPVTFTGNPPLSDVVSIVHVRHHDTVDALVRLSRAACIVSRLPRMELETRLLAERRPTFDRLHAKNNLLGGATAGAHELVPLVAHSHRATMYSAEIGPIALCIEFRCSSIRRRMVREHNGRSYTGRFGVGHGEPSPPSPKSLSPPVSLEPEPIHARPDQGPYER